MEKKSGNKYVGEYKDGKKIGQGTFTWGKSGNKYVGEFENNKINGQGTFIWKTGEQKYVGEWKDHREMDKARILGKMEINN